MKLITQLTTRTGRYADQKYDGWDDYQILGGLLEFNPQDAAKIVREVKSIVNYVADEIREHSPENLTLQRWIAGAQLLIDNLTFEWSGDYTSSETASSILLAHREAYDIKGHLYAGYLS